MYGSHLHKKCSDLIAIHVTIYWSASQYLELNYLRWIFVAIDMFASLFSFCLNICTYWKVSAFYKLFTQTWFWVCTICKYQVFFRRIKILCQKSTNAISGYFLSRYQWRPDLWVLVSLSEWVTSCRVNGCAVRVGKEGPRSYTGCVGKGLSWVGRGTSPLHHRAWII